MVSTHGLARKKISLLVSDLSKSGAGRWGGAVRPFLLAQALKRLGCEVTIFGFVFGEPANLNDSEFPIVAIPGKNYPQFAASAYHLLNQIDGDVVYAYKLRFTSFGIALLQQLKARRPVLLDIDDWELSWHGGDAWQYRPNPKQLARDLLKPSGALRHPDHPWYLKQVEGWVHRANAITTHTKFLQQRFGGVYLPNGKDTSLFDPELYDPESSRSRYGLADYRTILFPGAPRPYKGLEDLLAALDILDLPDVRLAIVGGSPYDDYDKQLRERWGRWLVQLPPQPVSKMPDIVAAAHVVAVPQRDDPATRAQFPLKLTDGMSMAKPILATRVGDIPDILGDTGYVVEPNSPEAIAYQLRWILDNPDTAAAQGRRARVRCVEHYSIDAMAAILANIIPQ